MLKTQLLTFSKKRVGGFGLGLERAGMEVVAQCEIDEKCRLVLKKHWPGVKQYEDVRKLTGKQIREEVGAIDLICGGFNCQPYSVAGERRGDQDDRHIWPEYLRLIQEIRPRWVIVENVAGLLSMGIDAILSDLDSIDYNFQTFDITAGSYGLPTLERHIWIIATPNGIDCKGREKEPNPDGGIKIEFPRNHPREYNRWNLPSARVCGMGERVPGRVDRLEQLGNAVDPFFPEITGRAIMEIERNINDKNAI